MLKKISIAVLVLLAAITGFLAYRAISIGFDYNFETFFPRRSKDTDFFKKHREKFGSDNDFVLVGVQNNSGIFNYKFLEKVQKLADTLATLPDVEFVLSPTSIKEVTRDPLMGLPNEMPYLRWKQDSLYHIDSIRIFQTPELIGSLFASDGKSLCIIIKHKERIMDDKCTQLTQNVNNLAPHFQFDEFHVAGRCIGQSFYTGLMKGELVLLLVSALIAMMILMIIIYRNVYGVILPLLVVGLVVGWTVGMMELTGKSFDMLSNAIPTILVVTGLSVAIHIITKYFDHIKEGWNKFDSIKDTVVNVGLANLFTTLTTVVGFASLATTGIKPIDDFGLYTALGVVFSFVISYTLLPAMLYLLPAPVVQAAKVPTRFLWNNMLNAVFSFITRRKFWIIGASALVIASMIYGITRIEENTRLLEDLNNKSKLKKDFVWFGAEFQGTRPFELAVWVEDSGKTVLDKDVLLEVEKMEKYLAQHYGVGFMLSPVALVKAANRSYAGGDPSSYEIPESDTRFQKITKELKAIQANPQIKSVLSDDFRSARIQSMIDDIGSNKAHQQNLDFYEFVNSSTDTSLFKYKLTGTAELIDKNNRNLAWNIATGILIAFAVIGIIIGLMFKSFKVTIIAIVTNVVPLIILGGIMGYFGISLKTSTAILFAIAFGIAVDDTIHFLSRFNLEIRKEKSVLYALKRTFLTTGKAMIITSVILCTGFAILGISSFLATRNIGVLTSITLFFAMICNITLLPVLILLFYKQTKITSEPPLTQKK